MPEATEELVRVFLEKKGYLVTCSKKIDVKTHKNSPRTELDIVAVKIKGKKTDLPLRIVGEVKSYGLGARSLKKLDQRLRKKHGYRSREDYGRYKWINIVSHRASILRELKSVYGGDFEFVLFCSHIDSKYEKQIKEFLAKEKIQIVLHKDILSWLLDQSSNEYTDNPIMQVIRLLKKNLEDLDCFKE